MLSDDPEFPTYKASYRDFLQDTSKFRPAVEFRDESVQRKVLQTYRLQFLKDVVLSRAIDDATFNVLNSCIIFNQIDIISHVQQEEAFLRSVVGMFIDVRWWSTIGIHGRVTPMRHAGKRSRSPTPPLDPATLPSSVSDDQRRDAVFLVQQLCTMAKNVQLPARMALFRTVVEQGALHALQWALAQGSATSDQLLTSTAGELLTLLVEHDTAGARAHILRQVSAIRETEKEKEQAASKSPADAEVSHAVPQLAQTLLSEMVRVLNSSQEWALKSQMADSLRILLDSPTESQGMVGCSLLAESPFLLLTCHFSNSQLSAL